MFTQQIVKDYQAKYPHDKYGFHRWNKCLLYEWEYRLLLDKNAITARGIKQSYPILKIIKSNGDCDYKDLGGDLNYIRNKINAINKSGTQQGATVDYTAKNYDEWVKFSARKGIKQIKQQIAIDFNMPKEDSDMVNVEKINFN